MNLDLAELKLRPIQLSDWPRVHEWASVETASRYQPWGPNTAQETEAFVSDAVQASTKDPQSRYVWAAEAPATGVIGIGELKIRSIEWQRGEISYAVHCDWWGRGVAGEIARLLCWFGFEQLGLQRVEATCDPRNIASARVLERAGMIHEGRLRRSLRIDDGWRDSELYSFIRPDWEASDAALLPGPRVIGKA